jgi:hypothetical protein
MLAALLAVSETHIGWYMEKKNMAKLTQARQAEATVVEAVFVELETPSLTKAGAWDEIGEGKADDDDDDDDDDDIAEEYDVLTGEAEGVMSPDMTSKVGRSMRKLQSRNSVGISIFYCITRG